MPAVQEGIDPADAHTATNLVCAEIARRGAPADAHYRVSLGKLGSLIILSAARVSDDGATVESRELRIGNIEEVPIAAPRIAESIVHGTPLAETQTIDNIVSSESRVPQRKTGSAHFALGLVGMFPPFGDATGVAPGVDLDLHYEIGQGEVGGAFRAGGIGSGNGSSPQMGLAVLSVGGRYFTSDRDLSPYFGGGLAWSYFSLGLPDGGFSGNASGLGAFADAGLEVMRTSHAHLAFGLRLDVPFYQLNATGGTTTATGYGTGQPQSSAPSQMYYAPLSLETRLTF